jgi:RimJ/RimL family protein N-acetyltransferase
MAVSLAKSSLGDCGEIHEMRFKIFMPLLDKYKDYDTNPANRPLEHVINNMNNPNIDFYFIKLENKNIGYIRIKRIAENKCNLSQIAILPEYQGNGYAQEAICQIEAMYPSAEKWELETIKQEARLRHIYEKMGYKPTGKEQNINDNMDIVFYEKEMII